MGITLVELMAKENKSGLAINVVIEKEGGVTLDDCERVTRLLNDRLSIMNELDVENYRLQVSSPGISRVFKSREEYEIFKSRPVIIYLNSPLNDENGERLTFEGILEGTEGDFVILRLNNEEILKIPFDKIQKTKLNG